MEVGLEFLRLEGVNLTEPGCFGNPGLSFPEQPKGATFSGQISSSKMIGAGQTEGLPRASARDQPMSCLIGSAPSTPTNF